MTTQCIEALIRDVPDFPKPGIVFKDIAPLLADASTFSYTISLLADQIQASGARVIAAIESRGFIFGAPIARKLGLPLQLVRKAGKLPYTTIGKDYELEYGTDRVEMHTDAVRAGERFAVVDDVLATGGTAGATADLIREQGGNIVCCSFLLELGFLNGRDKLAGLDVQSLLVY